MGILDSFEMAPLMDKCLFPFPQSSPSILLQESIATQPPMGWSCDLGTWHMFVKWWSRRGGESVGGIAFLPSRILYLVEAWKGSKSLFRETSM